MASLEWVTVSTSRQSSAAQPCPTDKQDRFLQTEKKNPPPIKTSGKESQGPLLTRRTRPWSIMILAQKFTTKKLTTLGDVRSLVLSIEDSVLYPKSLSDSLSHL